MLRPSQALQTTRNLGGFEQLSYYVAVANEVPLKRRSLEMTLLSLGVSTVTFDLGLLVGKWLPLDV